MELYTAVGLFSTRTKEAGKQHPVIRVNGREHLMDMPEMLVWAALNHRFLEPDQLRLIYSNRVKELGLLGMPDSNAYIDRLLQNGLIACGCGERGHDALYDLVSNLGVAPVRSGPFYRLGAFMKLFLVHRLPLGHAKRAFRKEKLSSLEKRVMALTRRVRLSAAEIITCIDAGKSSISDENQLVDAIYGDSHTTYNNIAAAARCRPGEQDSLVAIANLYLRRQIYFERGFDIV